MNAGTNTASAQKLNSLRKKLLIRLDRSNRIFLITEKQKEENHDDDNFTITTGQTIDKENEIKPKSQKKSFKKSCRNALEGWKRKITKIKHLLFRHKTSSNEIQTPSSSHPLTNDLSPSIISDDATSNQLLTTNKTNNITESSELDALVKLFDEIIARNDATLNDLLARADKLEKAVNLLFHLN